MTRCLLVVVASLVAVPPSAVGQAVDPAAPPAHVGIVDGAGSITRDGRAEELAAGLPLVEGDTVRTDEGRMEMLLRDGSVLYLDWGSELDVQSDTLLRLLAGRATLVASSISGGFTYQIDTPAASLQLDAPGEYRAAVLTDPATGLTTTELEVVRGSGRVNWAGESLLVRTGERSAIREGEAAAFPRSFNSARWTPFDRWVRDRQSARLAGRSGAYLPSEMQLYAGTFDRYGTWGEMPEYGYVWYPTAIHAGWRPYYNGHWQNGGRYGWLWVGSDPWGWPTHHFGDWGFHRGSWFWRPGRAWAPTRVWWGVSAGYVAWCPIGIDGRPLFGFWGHGGSRGVDPWRGWTIIGRGAFGTRAHVGSVAVDFRSFGRNPSSTFVFQRQAPAWHVAVPRNTWTSRGRVGAVPAGPLPGVHGQRLRGGFVGSRGFGSGLGPAGGTRIDAAPFGMAPVSPYGPAAEPESPYRRAERVAAERRASAPNARQRVPRSQASPGSAPSPSSSPLRYFSPSPYQTPSPYPPQYQAVPSSRAPLNRPVAPFAPGSWRARPAAVLPQGMAVPRQGPIALQGPAAQARLPRAGVPQAPAPQGPPAARPAPARTAVARSPR
jgi:hypothetical protein